VEEGKEKENDKEKEEENGNEKSKETGNETEYEKVECMYTNTHYLPAIYVLLDMHTHDTFINKL
jgi:hypothetical protein